jgi:dipeptidyl aminopeptidase/acylaminoacyl peptidase
MGCVLPDRGRAAASRLMPLLLAVAVLAGCTGESAPEAEAPAASPSATPSSGPSDGPSASASASPSARAEQAPRRRVDPVSLPAFFDKRYDGRGLALRSTIAETDSYTSYSVTYRSNGLTVSGKLDVPRGKGPFPALVLAHGYIDPATYDNGQGMRREQDWFARAGFVVLHTDYRNHAFSSDVPTAERRMRLGYTTDVVNAVHALRRTTKVAVDDDRIGLVGRSMGGGVVYNVLAAQPGLVDAAAVYAPVSSRTSDNFDRWIRDDPGRSALSDYILGRYGEPRKNPRFWRQVSPRTYFSRITEPVLIHHGTADESCPIRWSRETLTAMKEAGVRARMYTYEGEPHAFIAQWPLSMQRTTAFLRANLEA